MNALDLFTRNRVILCHFDSYSTALVFARWGTTLIGPAPLPESSAPIDAPAAPGAAYDTAAVMDAACARYGLNAAELKPLADFNGWMSGEDGPLCVHVLRFTTFEAPKELIEPHGGVFKPISELRGSNMTELKLLRQVFDLIMAGGAR